MTDVATRNALLAGDLSGRTAAPGWPHEDTAPGLGFLDSGGLTFLVVDDDDRIVGECGTKTPPTDDGMVEIGYGLAAPSRGHGLGSAAVAALVAWLADQPEVRAVEAEVHIGNVASSRLLERLRFIPADTVVNGFRRYRFDLPR